MNEPEKIRHFTQLKVWQEGHKLALQIYRHTESFPKQEMFGLVSQMRRAAISVTSNISEGFGRRSEPDKLRFYSMAHGSLMELQNQLIVSKDLGYLKTDSFTSAWHQSDQTQRLLNALISKIRGDLSA